MRDHGHCVVSHLARNARGRRPGVPRAPPRGSTDPPGRTGARRRLRPGTPRQCARSDHGHAPRNLPVGQRYARAGLAWRLRRRARSRRRHWTSASTPVRRSRGDGCARHQARGAIRWAARILSRTHGKARKGSENRIRTLARRTPLSQGDLVRVGVKLGRLHPDCERHAYERWPLATLTKSEPSNLEHIAYAINDNTSAPGPGENRSRNVVALRPPTGSGATEPMRKATRCPTRPRLNGRI